MSRDQNAGGSHNIKIHISSFERVKQFKYLVTALSNQNSLQEEIKSWLKSGNACYHSAQNLLSSSLLSKNISNKVYSTIALSVFVWVRNLVSHIEEGTRLGCLRIGC